MDSGNRKLGRTQRLVAVMALVVLGCSGMSIFLLYQAAFAAQGRWLSQLAETQVHAIEAVAIINDNDAGAALRMAKQAHADARYEGLGTTGGFQLVRAQGKDVVVMIGFESAAGAQDASLQRGRASDALFRAATSGGSGIYIGIDENNRSVLAAYRFIPRFQWAVIVKMELAEIRAPFVNAALWAALFALLGIWLGTFILQRHSNRVIDALSRSKEFAERLLQNLSLPAFVIGRDHRVLLWNRACEELTGLRAGAVLGTDAHWRGFYSSERPCLADLVANGDDPSELLYPDSRQSSLVHGGLHAENWCDLPRSGRRRLSMDAAPIYDAEANLIAVVETLSDVTLHHQLQEELLTARDEALAGSRTKSQFLANMSHEIRTPMNGVLGMLELLKDSPLTADQRDLVRTAHRSADALLAVINDILDISKIEAGRLELESIDMDLREVVEEVTSLLACAAHEKHLELTCLVPPDLPTTVRGDPTRVRQVLMNLIGNAVKFTSRGEVNVEVQPQQCTDTLLTVKFTVRDTGVGIAEDALPRLFQSFSQADGSMTRRFGGTGLGLAISRQLVQMMGGDISVETSPNRGSTFTFTIEFPRAQPLPAVTLAADGLRGVRILVVDDNAVNRQILERMLESWGATVECAESGVLALAVARAAVVAGKPYDIAVLDMQMPLMDGLTLSAQISADAALSSIKRVLLTSASPVTTAEARSAGISILLHKPVQSARLHQHLVRLQRATTDEECAATTAPLASAIAFSDLRVLLVEDNAVNQLVACGMLEKLGITPDIAADGREALSQCTTVRYDLVLMDCQLPELDGFGATAGIRDHERAQSLAPVPIIAMTANAMEGDRERCLAAGMNDYISKPVRMDALERTLRRWLPGGDGMSAAA
jgi:signal transduction histidine kinase/CheY-like chemotaxis protein